MLPEAEVRLQCTMVTADSIGVRRDARGHRCHHRGRETRFSVLGARLAVYAALLGGVRSPKTNT